MSGQLCARRARSRHNRQLAVAAGGTLQKSCEVAEQPVVLPGLFFRGGGADDWKGDGWQLGGVR